MLELLADRYPHYVAADQNPALKHSPAGHAPFNVTDELLPFRNGPLLVTGWHSKAYGFAPIIWKLIVALDAHPGLAQQHAGGKSRRQYIADQIYLTTVKFMDRFSMHRHIRGNWNFHLCLEKGLHRIRVDHTMTNRWALDNALRLWWRTPSSRSLEHVPDDRWYTTLGTLPTHHAPSSLWMMERRARARRSD